MLHIHSYPSMHFCFQLHVCNSDLVVYLYYMYNCTYMYINYNMCINIYIYVLSVYHKYIYLEPTLNVTIL